ncbi:MAG TPA: hypothetical protein VHR88_01575 [Solirubrobacteraceae bacterium]|jgi:hypothetical protein|nr:hypothetical protein [Solirubrobacteraceae bacterium]
MSGQEPSGDRISADFTGATVSGTVGVGKGIDQRQAVGSMTTEVTQAELAELRSAFDDVRAQVRAEAPEDKRGPALERIDELEEALVTDKPDPATAGYVKGWFARNAPSIAGAVVSLVVHPVVGKLVEAGGNALAEQFARLVGGDE